MKNREIKVHRQAIKRFSETLEIIGEALRELAYITEELERYGCMNDVRRDIFDGIKDTVVKAKKRIEDEQWDHKICLIDAGVE